MLANADKATKRTLGTILTSLSKGLGLGASCALAGISRDTLVAWRERDPTFSADLEEASAAFTARHVSRIDQADDWKASAWLLGRSPASKQDWGQAEQSKGSTINIVMGIDRDKGITIEGEKA